MFIKVLLKHLRDFVEYFEPLYLDTLKDSSIKHLYNSATDSVCCKK